MIGNFIEFFYFLNMCSYNTLLFFVSSNCSEYFSIHKLTIKLGQTYQYVQSKFFKAVGIILASFLQKIILNEPVLSFSSNIILIDSSVLPIILPTIIIYICIRILKLLTSYICSPSISQVSSGPRAASQSIFKVTGVKSLFLRVISAPPLLLSPQPFFPLS